MQGLQQNKFVGFGFAEVGFAYPMMQKPGTSVADLRGRKVWTPDNDPSALRAFEAFGISPIPLPIADVLAGLQTGLIDSIGSPPIGAIALQWHTQVEHAIELPLLYVYGTFAISERGFKKIPAEYQDIVRKEMTEAVSRADQSARNDHNSAKAALAAQGVQWNTPSAAEFEQWNTLARKASERLVQEGYISEAAYQQVQKLLADHRANSS